MDDEYYIFKVYLNQYGGEIARKLCAFLTGIVAEDDDYEASRYIDKEVTKSFLNSMRIEQGDKGWKSPCRNDGNQVHLLFEAVPTDEQIKIIKDRFPLFEQAYKEKDVYAEYIGDINLQCVRMEITRVVTKEIPIAIVDEPKSAL